MTVPRFDPTKNGVFPKHAPRSHNGRQARRCTACGEDTPHDLYEAILGTHLGFSLPFGRKKTTGKVGKRSHWAFCAICGTPTPLDEAAHELLE